MSVIRSNYLKKDETQSVVMHQTTDGKAVIHQQNDVSGILRQNHFLQSTQTLHHQSEIMNHVASIDVLALKEWCRQRGITRRWWQQIMADDGKLLREFLNDPENKVWRTRLGRV